MLTCNNADQKCSIFEELVQHGWTNFEFEISWQLMSALQRLRRNASAEPKADTDKQIAPCLNAVSPSSHRRLGKRLRTTFSMCRLSTDRKAKGVRDVRYQVIEERLIPLVHAVEQRFVELTTRESRPPKST